MIPRHLLLRAVLGVSIFVGGATGAGCAENGDIADSQSSDVTSSDPLAKAGERYAKLVYTRAPYDGTVDGRSEFDSQTFLPTKAADDAAQMELKATLAELQNINREALSPEKRIQYDMLKSVVVAHEREARSCFDRLLGETYRDNLITRFDTFVTVHAINSESRAKSYMTRLQAIVSLVDQFESNMKEGLKAGVVSPQSGTQELINIYDRFLKAEIKDWNIVSGIPSAKDFSGAESLKRQVQSLVTEAIKPRLVKHREFLAAVYLPKSKATLGYGDLPGGVACYESKIQKLAETTLPASKLHELGEVEMSKLQKEIVVIANKMKPGSNFRTIGAVAQMVRDDKALRFGSAGQVKDVANAAIARAKAKSKTVFNRLPTTDPLIAAIPPEAEATPNDAYYLLGSSGEKRPGEFRIGLTGLDETPNITFESIVFHEAIPGHHFQEALADELSQSTKAPGYMKVIYSLAYVEGWALYAERYADELGLYSSDSARLGMLGSDALRAARLVVDTGIHTKGWTKEVALAYLVDHTFEGKAYLEKQVERYAASPAQALSYKVGQLKILELRTRAQKELGAKYTPMDFHDAVIGGGTLTLGALEARVVDYISSRK